MAGTRSTVQKAPMCGWGWGVYSTGGVSQKDHTASAKTGLGVKTEADCEKLLKFCVNFLCYPETEEEVGGKDGHRTQPQDTSLPGSPLRLAAVPSRPSPASRTSQPPSLGWAGDPAGRIPWPGASR